MPPNSPNNRPFGPYWTTNDGQSVRLYHGDVLTVLRKLPTKSIQCVVTSPPYWGLRSYLSNGHANKHLEIGSEKVPDCLGWARQHNCASDDWDNGCYVCRSVLILREIRRVLRDDGTVWWNLGDTYASGGENRNGKDSKTLDKPGEFMPVRTANHGVYHERPDGIPQGSLTGVPWRVALAAQADGWVLRSDVIWAKPSPMPESVRNRCTKAHEYVFMLTKGMDYYCDMEAIKETRVTDREDYYVGSIKDQYDSERTGGMNSTASKRVSTGELKIETDRSGRNKRTVWQVSSHPYPGAHYATFPPKLIEPMILAGTSEKGCCAKCGAPWVRETEREGAVKIVGDSGMDRDRSFRHSRNGVDSTLDSGIAQRKTTGWSPQCACNAPTTPCTVLDPFMGSGTVAEVCLKNNRHAVGIELSEAYIRDNQLIRICKAIVSDWRIEKRVGGYRLPYGVTLDQDEYVIHKKPGTLSPFE